MKFWIFYLLSKKTKERFLNLTKLYNNVFYFRKKNTKESAMDLWKILVKFTTKNLKLVRNFIDKFISIDKFKKEIYYQ